MSCFPFPPAGFQGILFTTAFFLNEVTGIDFTIGHPFFLPSRITRLSSRKGALVRDMIWLPGPPKDPFFLPLTQQKRGTKAKKRGPLGVQVAGMDLHPSDS